MTPFRLIAPESVEEASTLLAEHGDAAVVCAGGTELIILVKLGLADPSLLVRLDRLGLGNIHEDDRVVRLGATVTHTEASRSSVVRTQLPLVSGTLATIANPRVRAVGTLGGSICFAEPHSDLSTLMLLHDAAMVLSTGKEERRVRLGEFVTGTLTTSRRDEEILVALEVPRPNPGVRSGYERFVIGERPNVAVGCTLEVSSSSGEVTNARVVAGCAGPIPMRTPGAERVLNGVALDEQRMPEAVSEAAASCARECEAYDEDEISAWYKRRLVQVMAKRAISTALGSGAAQRRPRADGR